MQPAQTLRIATVSLLLTAGFPLLPTPDSLLPAIAQTVRDSPTERLRQRNTEGDRRVANRLFNLANQQFQQNQFELALATLQKTLEIRRRIRDLGGEGDTLFKLGQVQEVLGNYEQALNSYQQAAEIFSKIGERDNWAGGLSGMGTAYLRTGRYSQAIQFFQQALTILPEATIPLNGLGLVYTHLGQYDRALKLYQQVLAIRQKSRERLGEASSLINIGVVYEQRGQYQDALNFYQQALNIYNQVDNPIGKVRSLNLIGEVYNLQGQPSQAMGFFQSALKISNPINDSRGKSVALNNIGRTYFNLQEYSQTLEFYQQALNIRRKIGDREGESQTLNDIGGLFVKQKQPELAIAFYKQSVNVRETIRQDIRNLDRTLQESYANTVSSTYRSLADLLLAQGRILEAQQVLELLKIQEIREFTREARTTTSAGIATTVGETKILKEHGSLIAFGQKVDACKQSRCAQLSQLNDQQQALTQQYNQTVASFEKEIRRRKSVDDALFDPRNLSSKAKEIVESQPGTVLIYPFVLEDKIWLLWAAKGGIVKTVAVQVSRKQLGETVVQFRGAVQDPTERKAMLTSGKQLYDWLIKPLEPELKANKIQNLVFSLDRVTRYIPISALFDGEKFLIENYAVSTILSAELTDLRDRLPASNQTSILALGASEFRDFSPLPYVPAELNAIVQQTQSSSQANNGFSGSKFLNQAFNFRALRDNLVGHKILHIATHGKFVSGRPEDSFLVLGTGEKLTIPEIKTLQDLSNIHLVVLSACQTALGGDQEGVEISGLSSYFLNNGAKAVMASLWSVDDASTSVLMSKFYRTLASSTAEKPMTKAEALRQAQLSLLREGNNFSRPYHWAPFMLIGNGL
jgi:CHAT domain-containing protein/Flp pilus assembly protein TadD